MTPLSGWLRTWTFIHPCQLEVLIASVATRRACNHSNWSPTTQNNFLTLERSWGLWRLHDPLEQVVLHLNLHPPMPIGGCDSLRGHQEGAQSLKLVPNHWKQVSAFEEKLRPLEAKEPP